MKSIKAFGLQIFWMLFLSTSLLTFAYGSSVDVQRMSNYDKCQHIVNNYLDAIQSYKNNLNQIIFKNGHVVLCDDGQKYNLQNSEEYQQQMVDVDLSDILLQGYPETYSAPIFEINYSPGRFRNDQLFINTYIDLSTMPASHLRRSAKDDLSTDDVKVLARYLQNEIVKVNFLDSKINFNQRNGAAEALARVSDRLNKDFPQQAAWIKKNRNMSGGFNMRFISGTNRLSSHSWGIAVDFTIKNASSNLKWFDSYWKWVALCAPNLKCSPVRTDAGAKYRRDLDEADLQVQIFESNFDHFPPEVVQVFAEEGFIWGGHWHHFDTMHFEYRPEFF